MINTKNLYISFFLAQKRTCHKDRSFLQFSAKKQHIFCTAAFTLHYSFTLKRVRFPKAMELLWMTSLASASEWASASAADRPYRR